MNGILWFDECSYILKDKVGGKNASLGELQKISKILNINVANGFAITIDIYDRFIKKNNLQDKITELLNIADQDINNVKSLQTISRKLKDLIMNSNFCIEDRKEIIDNYNILCGFYANEIQVAVRSSAIAEDLPNASFAGQQDTFLNISSTEHLIKSIKKCYASLFNVCAISYRKTNNITIDQVKISVGIQKMVRSDLGSAGVAFTMEPNTGYNNAILINSSWGLGEIVVSGNVNPDEFLIDKRTLELTEKCILSKNMGLKNRKIIYQDNGVKEINTTKDEYQNYSLNDKQIVYLAKNISKLEKHYQSLFNKSISIDVEWAIDGLDNKIYIIQTRPETVHSNNEKTNMEIYNLKTLKKEICTGISVGDKITKGKVKKLKDISKMDDFKEGEILVTAMTTPDWEPIMKKSSGLITNKGGKTCHAAIVARELGINACVGTENATEIFSNGDEITIDCSEEIGKIYPGLLDYQISQIKIDTEKVLPIKLMLNIANPELAFKSSLLPQNGVGLVRLEFIISNYIKIHPSALVNYNKINNTIKNKIDQIIINQDPIQFYINKLGTGIAKIASAFFPNDVIIRLTDFKTNEYKNLIGGELYEPEEENPMLGWRGASRYYSTEYLESFKLECEAIKLAREEMKMTNIIIMIPFCRTPEECQKVIQLLTSNGLERGKNGLQIYLMCEIPSNVIEADIFSQYIDGISIGGNDLLQLTLGIDRDSERVANLSCHTNLSYRRLIKQAITEYKKYNVKVGFCGQQPSDSEEFCNFLIENGIDSISVTSDSFMKIYSYI